MCVNEREKERRGEEKGEMRAREKQRGIIYSGQLVSSIVITKAKSATYRVYTGYTDSSRICADEKKIHLNKEVTTN